MFVADLGGPHDGPLMFNIVHHLSPEQARMLFSRVAGVLRPGAPACVLDLYDRPAGEEPDSGSYMGLFFHLTSSADTYSQEQVSGWLRDSGFLAPKVHRLPRLPALPCCARRRRGWRKPAAKAVLLPSGAYGGVVNALADDDRTGA
jgi:hypothetical protein